MTDREQIEALYREYWRCMISKDADGLRAIFTEDYSLLHMSGVKQSAEVFLNGLQDGTFHYYSAEHDSITVQVDGDQACMTGKSRVLAAVYGGGTGCLENGKFQSLHLLRGPFGIAQVCGHVRNCLKRNEAARGQSRFPYGYLREISDSFRPSYPISV